MDYTETAKLADMRPKFKGILTSLLAESFYEEEMLESLIEIRDDHDLNKSLNQGVGNYIKPFS